MHFSHEDILSETRHTFGASTEASAPLLGFVFKMLSLHPHVQERVYAELSDIFQGRDRLVTVDDLRR